MSIGHGEWALAGRRAVLPALHGTFSDDGNQSRDWGIAEDGADFTTDFDLVYRRVAT